MSNPIRPATGTPEDWLRHAKSDLAVAQDIENNPDVLPNQTAFHAQQAAEKSLKGVMIHEGIAFPRTHDLKDLVKQWTNSGRAWPAALTNVKTLSPFAVESRYPGYIHPISRAEVRAAIEMAEQVIAWAEAQLHPPPPTIPGGASK